MINLIHCGTNCGLVVCAQAVQQDLQSREGEVNSLQEISSQILLQDQREDTLEAKEKVHVISNKLRLLIRQIAHDLHTLQSRLVCFTHRFLCRLCFSLTHTDVLISAVLLQDSSGPNVGRTGSSQHQVQKHYL